MSADIKSFTIHDLPKSERPRERLQKHGAEALSSQELIALLLGRGIKGESVMVTAQRLLSAFGNIKNLSEHDETGDHGLNYVDDNFPLFLLCGCLVCISSGEEHIESG